MLIEVVGKFMMDAITRFVKLVQRFVSSEIDAEQFADQAVDFWYQEYDHLQGDDRSTQIIADLCLEADALSNEPPFDTTPEALLDMARKALSELLELQTEHN